MSSLQFSPVAKAQFNFRASIELIAKLDDYAQQVGQSRALIANQALEDYLNWRIPLKAALQEAVAQADRADFAKPAELERFFDAHED